MIELASREYIELSPPKPVPEVVDPRLDPDCTASKASTVGEPIGKELIEQNEPLHDSDKADTNATTEAKLSKSPSEEVTQNTDPDAYIPAPEVQDKPGDEPQLTANDEERDETAEAPEEAEPVEHNTQAPEDTHGPEPDSPEQVQEIMTQALGTIAASGMEVRDRPRDPEDDVIDTDRPLERPERPEVDDVPDDVDLEEREFKREKTAGDAGEGEPPDIDDSEGTDEPDRPQDPNMPRLERLLVGQGKRDSSYVKPLPQASQDVIIARMEKIAAPLGQGEELTDEQKGLLTGLAAGWTLETYTEVNRLSPSRLRIATAAIKEITGAKNQIAMTYWGLLHGEAEIPRRTSERPVHLTSNERLHMYIDALGFSAVRAAELVDSVTATADKHRNASIRKYRSSGMPQALGQVFADGTYRQLPRQSQ